jgi:FO synthase
MPSYPQPDRAIALDVLNDVVDAAPLLAEAARLRDEGFGRTVTYSRKVFIPLTTLCQDTCTYCTFAKPPGAGGEYLEPDDVLAIAVAGQAHGCTEALFTLGDRPEARWPQAEQWLSDRGYASTLDYVRVMSEAVGAETSLFPHANPGLMESADFIALRPSNPSMGMMLENISPRLMEPGMPHYNCPDKDPVRRMATIDAAGEAKVPFTTGVLVGIGENNREIVDSLFALADAQQRFGQIQEVIVQNFRAKRDTLMRLAPEPTIPFFVKVVALARWIMGPTMSIQVPPNLTEDFSVYLDAGINDWGGVSPLTIDWVNPEAPWPQLEKLGAVTASGGFDLKPRLPVYPAFQTAEWVDESMLAKVRAAVDSEGNVADHVTEGVGV